MLYEQVDDHDKRLVWYYPGTIKAVTYDGTFAVDYLYTNYEDGSGEETKHEVVYPENHHKLRV